MEPYSTDEHYQEAPRRRSFSEWKHALLHERHPRHLQALEGALHHFSAGERLALYLLATLMCLSALLLVAHVDAAASLVVPVEGGSLTEGEVSPARFINPLLAVSQADQDISALVYSGLMRALPDGSYVPDLALDYTISNDGRTYTFHLRPKATFQDGSTVTAADVLFTVQEAQDPAVNSIQRANWTGVSVSSPDPETVVFTLPHAYAPFIENTTLGVLPKALWQSVSPEEFPFTTLNMHPIGSGPYKISKVSTDSTGAASRYDLVPFSGYALGAPYLSKISFVLYPGAQDVVDALNAKTIDAVAGISASALATVSRTDVSLAHVPLPRDFGVFFNQSHNDVLADAAVRSALNAAVDKQRLIANSLNGEGVVLDSPIPPDIVNGKPPATPLPIEKVRSTVATSTKVNTSFVANARALLQRGGWTWNGSSGTWTKNKKMLSFVLATADQPELVATANALVAAWRAAGIDASAQVYPLSQLNTNVIRPRAYDALLFGEVVGPQLDLYAFWHSSQRSDPGLNLAMYANSKTDALLSQARATTEPEARAQLYEQFATTLVKDTPAIFLYAPEFLYVVPNNVNGVQIGSLGTPSDRFGNVYQWYTETKNVWAIFAPNTTAIQ